MDEASSDYERLQRLMEEKGRLETRLEESINRWAYLNELYEEIEKAKKPTEGKT